MRILLTGCWHFIVSDWQKCVSYHIDQNEISTKTVGNMLIVGHPRIDWPPIGKTAETIMHQLQWTLHDNLGDMKNRNTEIRKWEIRNRKQSKAIFFSRKLKLCWSRLFGDRSKLDLRLFISTFLWKSHQHFSKVKNTVSLKLLGRFLPL